MKVKDLRVGQVVEDDRGRRGEVTRVLKTRFVVHYPSGINLGVWVYRIYEARQFTLIREAPPEPPPVVRGCETCDHTVGGPECLDCQVTIYRHWQGRLEL